MAKKEYAEFMGVQLFEKPTPRKIGRDLLNFVTAKPLRDARERQSQIETSRVRLPDVGGPEPTLMDRAKKLVPDFLYEDAEEEGLREAALQEYPFTDYSKDILRKGTKVGDSLQRREFPPPVSSRFVTSGVTRHGNMRIVNRHGERRGDLAQGILSLLGPLTKTDSSINVRKGVRSAVVAHELLHAYVDQEGFPISFERFNKDFEEEMKTNKELVAIDRRALNSAGGDREDMFRLSHERFAYLGDRYGKEGLAGIPKRLRFYYRDIFRNNELFLVPNDGTTQETTPSNSL